MCTRNISPFTKLMLLLLCISIGTETYTSKAQQVKAITASDVASIVEMHSNLVIIDCRDSNQYAHSHIPGAISMDVRRPNGVSHYLDTLNRDLPYLIYCRTNIRIQSLLKQMLEKEFMQIYVMTEGWLTWEKLYIKPKDEEEAMD